MADPDHDSNVLAGIDLAAWQPPPPSSNLADAVIARLREPPPVAAIEPQPAAPRRARVARVLGIAAVAAAIAGLALWGTTRAPRPRHGDVVATPRRAVDVTVAAPPTVGAAPAPDAQKLRDDLAAAERRIAELTAQLAARDTGPAADAVMVPPPALEPYRRTGNFNIRPDEATRQQIASSAAVHNDSHIVGQFRMCVDRNGDVSRVQIVQSTRFETYDQAIVAGMRGWKYRPFVVDGKPAPVCSLVTFVYTPDAPKPAAPAAAACNGPFVENLVSQAAVQYDTGFPASALAIMRKALACEQTTRLYRLAGLFACAARDAKAARDFMTKIPESYRAALAQRCILEGILLSPSR